MSALGDIAKKLKRLKSGRERIVRAAVQREIERVEDIQRNQMEEGRNALGGDIGTLRNPIYSRKKKSTGGRAALGVVDLKNTGSFQKSIVARPVAAGIAITSTDNKTKKLTEKYGEEIFGFDEESIAHLKPVLVNAIQFEIRRELQKA